jgi:FXSXX-COOH protein
MVQDLREVTAVSLEEQDDANTARVVRRILGEQDPLDVAAFNSSI